MKCDIRAWPTPPPKTTQYIRSLGVIFTPLGVPLPLYGICGSNVQTVSEKKVLYWSQKISRGNVSCIISNPQNRGGLGNPFSPIGFNG